RLQQLGATPLLPRGDGDDQHYLGIDGALDPWLQEWWDKALQLFPLPSGLDIIPETVLPENTYNVQVLGTLASAAEPDWGDLVGIAQLNRRLTPASHFQDVRHFQFKTEAPYHAGDVMVVYPRNRPEKVQKVLDYFGWADIADTPIQFQPNPAVAGKFAALIPGTVLPHWLRNPISPRQLFENHLDIFGRPRRYFFQLLAFFALDAQHKERLQDFASTEGQNDLYMYAHKMRRTTFEVLQDFSSAKVPLKYLLDLVPAMRPRSFSISSSPAVHPSTIELTVAVVNYRTKLQEPRVGVCTDYMAHLASGGKRWPANHRPH
ncbi:NAPDH-dependent diflavin reductase, partial [Kappamyces sp. JEL0680]